MSVKIRLKAGVREIEVEASSTEDVNALLAQWWTGSDEPAEEMESVPNQKRKSKTRRKASARPSNPSNPDSFDTNSLANEIKNREDLDLIQKKIIHAKGDWYHKTAFVLSSADDDLTSTDIHKVLIALGIKSHLPRISEALSRNISKFITSSRSSEQTKYRLTASAKSEIDAWLSAK